VSNIRSWIKAFRLRTLPLALSSILMGTFLAAYHGSFSIVIFVLSVLTTVLLQVLSNLANDYGDSIHGADHPDVRKGPSRAVQSGAITASSMKAAVILFSLFSLASGTTLLIVSFGNDWKSFGYFLVLGILCILAAIAYTVGKKPYGYAGLGDLSVLLFFGFVGVLGSLYLYTKQIQTVQLLPSISCGVFAVAVLNINNIRDIDSDKLAGKYSIPVRIGRGKAVVYHLVLLGIGIAAAIAYSVIEFQSWLQFLFLITIPLLLRNARAVHSKPSAELDPFLKQMAITTLLFVLSFGAGLVLSRP
jgi:1,4-dihydroxy-2-naphthoate polyprenyltransferase